MIKGAGLHSREIGDPFKNFSGVKTVPGKIFFKCKSSQETIVATKGKCLFATEIIKASPRECQVSRKVAENHISIIEDLLLGYKLPVFTKRARRAMTAQPKFYLFDAGVYNHLRPRGPLDSPDEIGGMALEGLVLQHLKAWCDYSDSQVDCYFWRTRGGAEVDFVLYGEHYFYAVEVKTAKQIHPKSLKSLKTFLHDYPEAGAVLIYQGSEKLIVDGIPCWPISKFLLQLNW